MGILARAFRVGGRERPRALAGGGGNPFAGQGGRQDFEQYARAYSKNEIVYSSVKLLSTSAAEPHITGYRHRRGRNETRAKRREMSLHGVVNRAGSARQTYALLANGLIEEVPDHPLVRLLNQPNPLKARGQFWASIVMDRLLAGNSYALKARGSLNNTAELWRLRPDRVRILTGGNVVEGYEYTVGEGLSKTTTRFGADEVIHFRDPNPLDDYYGMPPLMSVMDRVDIDNYMKLFLRAFFERGGTGPAAILSTKAKIEPEAKAEISNRLRRLFGGPAGWHEFLIIDNAESVSFNQMGLDRGLRDALPKEIDAVSEARLAMVFGVPGSILGLLIGYESSSYANKRQDWQVLWDVTMTPLLSDLDDTLNLSLVPEFGGIDEVEFDLSDIRALREDEDKIQERATRNYQAGVWSLEEARMATGRDPDPGDGLFYVPPGAAVVRGDELEDAGAAVLGAGGADPGAGAPETAPEGAKNGLGAAFAAAVLDGKADARRGPGRPRLGDDAEARRLFAEAEELRRRYPRLTADQVASRLGVSPRTLRRYRDRFEG